MQAVLNIISTNAQVVRVTLSSALARSGSSIHLHVTYMLACPRNLTVLAINCKATEEQVRSPVFHIAEVRKLRLRCNSLVSLTMQDEPGTTAPCS